MRIAAVLVMLGVGLSVVPGTAAASTWSRPVTVRAGCAARAVCRDGETAPRLAVNANGRVAVVGAARVGPVQPQRFVVWVARGTASGGFGRTRVLGRGLRPSVAIQPDGSVLVAWTGDDALVHFARASWGHSFSRSTLLTPRATPQGDDDAQAIAQPNGATIVVYENRYESQGFVYTRLRAVRVSPTGDPEPFSVIGPGALAPGPAIRSDAAGNIAVCCASARQPGTTVILQGRGVYRYRPEAGWTLAGVPLTGQEQLETTAVRGSELAAGMVATARRTDLVHPLGVPRLLRFNGDETLTASLDAPLLTGHTGLDPQVALDGMGRNVIVYRQKADGAPIYRQQEPLYAATGPAGGPLGARQTLDTRAIYDATVLPLGRGALAVWFASGHRWGAASEQSGVFRPVVRPPGRLSRWTAADACFNHTAATAGRWAALAWTTADAGVQVTVGRP